MRAVRAAFIAMLPSVAIPDLAQLRGIVVHFREQAAAMDAGSRRAEPVQPW
jgi:hypothetical protein